jgi:hypothetical protein
LSRVQFLPFKQVFLIKRSEEVVYHAVKIIAALRMPLLRVKYKCTTRLLNRPILCN